MHFDLEMRFAPQRRAISRHPQPKTGPSMVCFVYSMLPHQNFQKWFGAGVFVDFEMCFVTAACISRMTLSLSLFYSSLLLFSSTLLFYSSRLCFSSLHIVGSLASKLPLAIKFYRYHLNLTSCDRTDHFVVLNLAIRFRSVENAFPEPSPNHF